MSYAAMSTKQLTGTACFAFGKIPDDFLQQLDACLQSVGRRRGEVYWAGRVCANKDGPRALRLRLVIDRDPNNFRIQVLDISKAFEILNNREESKPEAQRTYRGQGRDPRRDVGFE